MIDKNSVIPIYIQLQQIIKGRIVSGVYENGEPIPSESQFASQYEITRTTVRKAINNLVNEGLLIQIHGKGTFVNLSPAQYNIWNFGGFSNYLKKNNKVPVSKVIELNRVLIDKKSYLEMIRARGISEDGNAIYLTIDTAWIPLDLFPNIDQYDFSKESLYNIMATKYNISPSIAELSVKPTIDESIAYDYFKCKKGTPLLLVSGRVYSQDSTEVERVKVVYSPNINFNMITSMT